MSQYGWANCPDAVRAQVTGLLEALRETLGGDLVGVYLHGSLAMGCFNRERSDIDLLVVARQGMTVETKRRIAEMILRFSAAPSPIEISFLSEPELRAWQPPLLFDFHYSEDWREKLQRELSNGEWQAWNGEEHTDADLAAHITLARQRGVCLYGKPTAEVFPPIPPEHFRDSLLADFEWGYIRRGQNPVYFILNACRIHAYLREERICSKDEGGRWAISILPEAFREMVAKALNIYGGQPPAGQFEENELEQFAAYMRKTVEAHRTP